MKSFLTRIALISLLFVFLIPNLTSAETKTFIKEYTFHAGDEDSKNSSRVISLREVKRLLLEELGTYLESKTEVRNFQLTKDQITSLTAGIIKTELVEETWDGRIYWIKAKIIADSEWVIKSIDSLRKNRVKTKELAEVRKRADALLKENERLRKELMVAKGKKKQKDTVAYNKTIKDLNAAEWFEKGYAAGISGNDNNAVDAYSKAIELNPQYANAYNNRGGVYAKLDRDNQAIKDFNKAIELNPQLADAYYNRGCVYIKLGSDSQAIKDFNRAIELNLKDADAYVNRGNVYDKLGDFNQAINDYNKAIEINPQLPDSYYNRGIIYGKLGNYSQAINDYSKTIELGSQLTASQLAKAYYNRGNAYTKLGNYSQEIDDYSKAIELDPQKANAYFNRGLAYHNKGNMNKALNDYKIAARLGHKEAQDYLRSNRIDW